MLTDQPLTAARLDGIALKPHEHDLSRAADLDTDLLNVDYEGREVFPDADDGVDAGFLQVVNALANRLRCADEREVGYRAG